MSERIYTFPKAFREVADQRIPLGRLFSHGDKRDRELFQAAIFTCAMTKLTQRKDWYLKLIPEEANTPDFETWCTDSLIYEVENVQIPGIVLGNDDIDVSEEVFGFVVEKKIKHKSYPPNYILCVYLRFNRKINPPHIRRRFSELKPNIGQIWLMAATDLSLKRWRCVEVWPARQEYQDVIFDLQKELKSYGINLVVQRAPKP